jgi:hypothetical protein
MNNEISVILRELPNYDYLFAQYGFFDLENNLGQPMRSYSNTIDRCGISDLGIYAHNKYFQPEHHTTDVETALCRFLAISNMKVNDRLFIARYFVVQKGDLPNQSLLFSPELRLQDPAVADLIGRIHSDYDKIRQKYFSHIIV